MRSRFRLYISILLLVAAMPLRAQVFSTNNGKVQFRSDAPLELIRASSDQMKGKLDIGRKLFAFSVPVSSFEGFNNPLQKEHFNENYMESNLHPNATFSGKIIEDIDFSVPGKYTVRAKGNLVVHGVSQERIIKSELTVTPSGCSILSNFTVLLADHQIPIPKVVHEKLASEIKVEVKATLIKS